MAILTESQFGSLKTLLMEREHQLRTAIHDEFVQSAEQRLGGLGGPTGDAGDQSVADMLSDLGNAVMERQIIELGEIDFARNRMAEGNYGECIDCGDDIGYQRLAAFPTAKRCMVCQTLHERTYADEQLPRL